MVSIKHILFRMRILPSYFADFKASRTKQESFPVAVSILRFAMVMLLFAFTSVYSQENDYQLLYKIGNQQYNEANFDSALVAYNKIYESGHTSAELLYNIGNAHFKLRQIPAAILFYEKALKLSPNDADIMHNLSIANSRIVDKIEPVPQLFFKNWWDTFYKMFSADWWAIISLISLGFLLALTFVFIVSENRSSRKIAFFLGLIFLLITTGTIGMASQKYYYTKSVNEAIVFTPTITVKSSPSASSVDLFVLHEGTKVSLLDEVDGWKEIKIANGSVGWMPSESLRGI